MYYKCTKKSPYHKCNMRGTISEKEAFRQIDTILDHYTLHPLLYQWAMEILDSIREKELLERYDIAKIKNASMDDCEKQLHELVIVNMRTRGIIDDELFTKESKHIQALMEDIKRSSEDNEERQRKWYEIIGKTLNTLTSPKEKFELAEDIGERRAILLAIGPKATLRQVDIDELNEAIVVPQKSTKALTTKIIEIEPYPWVQAIDEGKRKIEQELIKNSLSGALTKNSPILQGSNSLKSHLYKLWSGRLDSNQRPHGPKPCALPTVLRPDKQIITRIQRKY